MGYFVPASKVQNLKDYKYQSEDRSITTKYVLKPFWKQFSQIFPMWMAPNVVTLLGFSFILVNVLTALYYDPFLNKETPRWTYFSYAIGMFLYQTFDACDGMHARRTGQSGPLGELFDHCIDSLNTTLSLFPFCSALGVGYSTMFVIIQFGCLCNFYLSTWEEYHTHKLFLSEFSGPVEGILLICTSFVLTGLFGPQVIWHTQILDLSNFVNYPFILENRHVMIVLSALGLVFNIISACRNVFEYYNNSGKSHLQQKKIDAIVGLAPFFVYYVTIAMLITIEPGFISFPLFLSIGLSMAFVVGRIIVAHLTKQSFPVFNFPLCIPSLQMIIYVLVVKFTNFSTSNCALTLQWLGLGLCLGIHAMFVSEIIYEFTTFLDVYALSIKHPKFA